MLYTTLRATTVSTPTAVMVSRTSHESVGNSRPTAARLAHVNEVLFWCDQQGQVETPNQAEPPG